MYVMSRAAAGAGVVFIALTAVGRPALAQRVSPTDIARTPKAFADKDVLVAGQAIRVRIYHRPGGDIYSTFYVSDGRTRLRVWHDGVMPCREGDDVVVEGRFEEGTDITGHEYRHVVAREIACGN